jgi:hypothetical protein
MCATTFPSRVTSDEPKPTLIPTGLKLNSTLSLIKMFFDPFTLIPHEYPLWRALFVSDCGRVVAPSNLTAVF